MISQLNQREQIFVAAGGIAIALLFLYLAIVTPYRNAMTRLDNQIEGRGRQLQEVQQLRGQYLAQQNELKKVERLLGRSGGVSSLTFLENLIETTAGRENLVSMRPQAPVSRDQFITESIEIKLEKLRLGQVLELLWGIEKASSPMQVSSLHLKQRFDDRSLLDAAMTVTTVRRAS